MNTKPTIMKWANGSNAYVADDAATDIERRASTVFAVVGDNGALLSICDPDGEETPYIIPANYFREFVVPGGIPAGARIVAKNLADSNFANLIIEVS